MSATQDRAADHHRHFAVLASVILIESVIEELDYFGRRHAMNGPMEFVLYSGVKGLRDLGAGIVVDARGVDVSNLLVEAPF